MSWFTGAPRCCLVNDLGGDVSEFAVLGLGLVAETVERFVVVESVAGDSEFR